MVLSARATSDVCYERGVAGFRGIFGRPWISLDEHLDLAPLDAIHEEVCLALTQLPLDYTGGSHRSMGIVPPSRLADVHTDYGEVIRAMTDAQFETFRSLAEDPRSIDAARREVGQRVRL